MRGGRAILLFAVLLVGCAKPQPTMVWIRLDGQRASSSSALQQQFETDKTICLGRTQQANLSGVSVYQGGIYGAIAMSERAQAVDAVARGCMAERGYELVPLEQAEERSRQLAAIHAQQQAPTFEQTMRKKKP